MNIRKNQYKKQTVNDILISDKDAFVHFDATNPNVIVPEHLKKQEHVVLQFGYNLPIPINDLKYDDSGISGTLSFNRVGFHCFVPWENVFAIIRDDGIGVVWDEDMPISVRKIQQKPNELKVKEVEEPKKDIVSNVVSVPKNKPKRELPPYLRVIK